MLILVVLEKSKDAIFGSIFVIQQSFLNCVRRVWDYLYKDMKAE